MVLYLPPVYDQRIDYLILTFNKAFNRSQSVSECTLAIYGKDDIWYGPEMSP